MIRMTREEILEQFEQFFEPPFTPVGKMPVAEFVGSMMGFAIKWCVHLMYQNNTALNFYKGLIRIINREHKRRLKEEEQRQFQKRLAKRIMVIASWPEVDYKDGTAPVCSDCESHLDVHRNPEYPGLFACANCGAEPSSVFIGFGQQLACISCGEHLPNTGDKRPESCPNCGQKFEEPPPF